MAELLDAQVPAAGPPDKRAKFLANFQRLDPDAELDDAGLDAILADPKQSDEFAQYVGTLNPDFKLTGQEFADELGYAADVKKNFSPQGNGGGGSSSSGGGAAHESTQPFVSYPMAPEGAAADIFGRGINPLEAAQENQQLQSVAPFAPGTAANPLAANLPNFSTGAAANMRLPFAEEIDYLNKLPAFAGGPAVEDGKERVAIPNDYTGAVPTGSYPLNLGGDGDRTQYFDRDLSKLVDGKEQTEWEAASRNFGNQLLNMAKGGADYLAAADRRLRDSSPGRAADMLGEALGLNGDPNRGQPFQEAADNLESLKGKVAPFHARSTFRFANPATWPMATSNAAALAAPMVLSALLPESKIAGVAQRLLAAGFDGQILEGSVERAQAAGLTGKQADNFILADGAASMLIFKLGSAGLTAAGQKVLQTELGQGIAAALKDRTAALTEAELNTVLGKAAARFATVAKESGVGATSGGILFGANEAKNIAAERMTNAAVGREAFPNQSTADMLGRVAGAAGEGALIGGLQGAATAIGAPGAAPAAEPSPAIDEKLYDLRRPTGQVELSGVQIVRWEEGSPTATVRGQDLQGNPVERDVPAGQLFEQAVQTQPVAPPQEAAPVSPVAAPVEAEAVMPDPILAPPDPTPSSPQPATEAAAEAPANEAPAPPPSTLAGALPALRAAKYYSAEVAAIEQYAANPESEAAQQRADLVLKETGFDKTPEALRGSYDPALRVALTALEAARQEQGRTSVEVMSLPPLAPEPDNVESTTPTENAPASPAVVEPSPAAPPVAAPPAPAKPAERARAEPAAESLVTLSKSQQAVNATLDALDNYNKLYPRQKRGMVGSAARAEIAELGRKAGLTVGVKADFSMSVTREGGRVTRFNEYTSTTPATNHVPLAERPEAARPFLENVVAAAEATPAVVQGLGIAMRGKALSARELSGAVEDIKASKNTMRAQLMLDTLEDAYNQGYVVKSEGTGMMTRRFQVPVDEYVGKKPVTEPVDVPLTDPELDQLRADDPNVRQAVEDYTFSDGSIDYARLANDEAGLPFLFDVTTESATKLAALARERTQQPTQETSPPSGEARTDGRSAPEGPARVDEASAGGVEEVAPLPAASVPQPKPTLAEQNVAAKQEFTDALAEFRAARKKGNGTAQSSLLGLPAFSAEESAALTKMVGAAVKLGAIKTKQIIARLRAQGLTDDDATDEQLGAFVKQYRTDNGLRKQKPADNYPEQRSAAKKAADEAAPAGQKARAHPLHYDEATQAGLTDEQKYYTPRKRIENVAEAAAYVDKHGTANAYNFLLNGGEEAMPAVVKDAMRSEVAQRLGDEAIAASKKGEVAEGNRLLKQQLDIIGQRAQVLTESAQVLSQNQYAGDISQNPERAYHDYVNGTKQAQQKKAQRDAELAKPADAEATKRRKATVERVLADGVVRAATARAVQEATGDAPEVVAPARADRKGYGDSNRFFTKARLAEARAKLKGLAFSAPLPAEAILVGAYHLEAGSRAFVDWSAKVVRDIGAKARPRLAELYEASKKEFISKGGAGKDLDGPDVVEAAIRAEAADNLADRIVGEVRPRVPAVFDPVQLMLETLTKKVSETLPTAASKPNSPREAIVHALQNEGEYADVFEQSKQLVANKINGLKISEDAKQALRAQLEDYYAEKVGQPFATRQVDKVLQVGAKELGIKLEKIVREHADVREASRRTLVDKLVTEADLTPSQASAYADVLNRRFAEMATQKAQSVAGRILAPVKAKLPASRVRTVIDKMSEALDIADASTPEETNGASPAAALLSKMGGIPNVTIEDAAAFRALIDKVRTASKGKAVSIAGKPHEVVDTKARQRAVVDLLRFGSEKLKAVSWWDKTRALQYSFRLSGLDTQGRNLKANTLHTFLEQSIVTPIYNAFRNRTAAGATTNIKRYFSAQGNGLAEAAYTLSTGYTGGEQEKFGDNSPLENTRNRALKAAAIVGRAMIAGDQVTSVPTAAGRTAELAFREGLTLARQATDPATGAPLNLTGRALRDEAWARANEIAYNTKEALADIAAIADTEGLAEITVADVRAGRATAGEYVQRAQARSIRMADLLRQARAQDNPAMMRDVDEYTRFQTLNNDPQGLVGKTIDALQGLKSGNKVADFLLTQVVPFMRVPANSMSRKLEWGMPLLTAARIVSGRTSLTMRTDSKYSRELTSEERYKMGIRAAVGTAGYLALAAAARSGLVVITGPPKNTDEDTLYPPQSIIMGDRVFSYKDTNFEYPLTVMAAVDEYVRKQKGKGQDPGLMRRVQVAALHSAAWTVTQGPFSGTSDFAAAMEKTMQGNNDAASGYLKRLLVSTAKTATYPAILNQSGQAWREWSGMPQRERKSNDLATELEVSWFGNTPYAEVGEDRINFAGQPIVLNRDGMSVWPDQQTQDIAALLVDKGLMPPRQSPTDDKLMLLDPKTGDRVTPMSDEEFREYAVTKGKGFIDRLTRNNGKLLRDIRTAPTAKKARDARNKALKKATEDALKSIEARRAQAGIPAQFKLSKEMQKDKDAANYRASQADE